MISVLLLEDSPVNSRFRVHELKRDFAGYYRVASGSVR